jgi:hypothetical protein
MFGLFIDATTVPMQTRSAQVPQGLLATSTLAPAWYVPSARRTLAPTRKLE